MKKITVGLLPLYIKLYDDAGTDRTYTKAFYETVANVLENQGFEVLKSDFCRIESEFNKTVKSFEEQGADVIVTLHAAYSPSLESINALSKTKLPIVVFDSTEAYELGKSASPINNNHGIHGVMDMCNLLKQRGKPYAITAGHIDDGKVVKKACDFIKCAVAAQSLKGSKVGSFGKSFKGMGDFLISKKDAKKLFGIEVVYLKDQQMKSALDNVSEEEINAEKEVYKTEYVYNDKINDGIYNDAIKSALAVRKTVKDENLDAFTINFLDVTSKNLNSMPFIECCKAMQNGIGYAGEGDVLTASFVGALLKVFKEVTFAEIFCPDWKNNKLLISHMGEMNYALATDKPEIVEHRFPYTDAVNPISANACFKAGKAVFGNLFKDCDGKYKLLVSDIEMLEEEKGFEESIKGWFKPSIPVDEFLEKLSEHGAIHHSFIVYDVNLKALEFFGKLIGLEVVRV